MKTLLWREFHWNRMALAVGACVLVSPYVLVTLISLWPDEHRTPLDASLFSAAAVFSLTLLPFPLAFIGGNAFAGERSDRSAEFLSYLPISRKARLLSKLAHAITVLFAYVLVNTLALWIAEGDWPPNWISRKLDTVVTLNVASTVLVVFGIGWLISAFQSSPTLAICGSIAVPLLTIMGLLIVIELSDIRDVWEFGNAWYRDFSAAFGAIGFALGTYLFLNRVEP